MTIKKQVMLRAGAIELSAIYGRPDTEPRALVVALHGGSYDSRYFDLTSTSDASFVDLASALGFGVVAIDRPGYGAAQGIDSKLLSFDEQVSLIEEAISSARQQFGSGAGVVLVGHSIGAMLSLSIAARGNTEDLLGVEASGQGVVWQPGIRELWQSLMGADPVINLPREPRLQIMYGPPGTYTEQAQAEDAANAQPLPIAELRDALSWHDRLREIAPSIHVPVRVTLAEFDNIWSPAPEARATLADVLKSSVWAEVILQRFSGHSTHGHIAARAHHLEVLSFAEQCIVRARCT